jgi:hypothetical protein
MTKALKKLETDGMFLNLIKSVYMTNLANIRLSREKQKTFLPKSGMRQGSPLFPLLFNVVLEFLARAIRQEQEIKEIQIKKKEVKLS